MHTIWRRVPQARGFLSGVAKRGAAGEWKAGVHEPA
jgi:hypothetical protein